MDIDWSTVWELAQIIGACLLCVVDLCVLCAINAIWLRYVLTPEEYQDMIDRADDWP